MEWEGHVTSWLDDHGHQSDGLDRKQIWAGIRLDQYRQGCPLEREFYLKIDIMLAMFLKVCCYGGKWVIVDWIVFFRGTIIKCV